MDGLEFTMPSPKRQRTESPGANRSQQTSALIADAVTPVDVAHASSDAELIVTDNVTEATSENNSMLDTLMQHVESESSPAPQNLASNAPSTLEALPASSNPQDSPAEIAQITAQPTDTTDHSLKTTSESKGEVIDQNLHVSSNITGTETIDLQQEQRDRDEAQHPAEPVVEETNHSRATTETVDLPQANVVEELSRAQEGVEGIPPSLDATLSADGVEGAEWEVDSSPYESSDSDTSSDDSSSEDDSDDDVDGDYAMLDPEEQARILMQGDAGSDDEGDKSKTKGEGAGLKTANEQVEDVPVIPDVTITDAMEIVELGVVEAVVAKTVLIRAKISGEYQVLQPGSLLCHKDRKIAGVVADLFGRVEEPMYTVQFRSIQDIEDRGLAATGTVLFYVPSHSTFVFTQPLKAIKGSDASNFHDEEVGDEEMEFSDDEAEAEHKRNLKAKRQGRLGDVGKGRGTGRGGRGGQRGNRSGPGITYVDVNSSAYGNGSIEMNYDDVEDGEEGYTPLARPSNLHQVMTSPPADATQSMPPPTTAHAHPDRGRGRGRGGRDRDRGNRGGRGTGRGHLHQQNRHTIDKSHFSNPSLQTNGQQPPQPPSLPFPLPPPPPMLAPQGSAFSQSLATSPMSPLPQQQFNFASAFQPQSPLGYNVNHQYQQQQQPHHQQGYRQQPNPYYNPSAMQQFSQQQYPQQQQQQQNGGYGNSWNVNQAAVAEVQRQLEQMRRNAAYGGAAYGGQQQ